GGRRAPPPPPPGARPRLPARTAGLPRAAPAPPGPRGPPRPGAPPARRSAAGTTYGNAFIETLLDLVDEPLLVVDPLAERGRAAAAELMRRSVERRDDLRKTLAATQETIARENRPIPVPYRPGAFWFFLAQSADRPR